jgi:hypothetical protein
VQEVRVMRLRGRTSCYSPFTNALPKLPAKVLAEQRRRGGKEEQPDSRPVLRRSHRAIIARINRDP